MGAPAPTVARFTFSPTDPARVLRELQRKHIHDVCQRDTFAPVAGCAEVRRENNIATTAHTYAAIGSYVVTLRIGDSGGATDWRVDLGNKPRVVGVAAIQQCQTALALKASAPGRKGPGVDCVCTAR